MQFNFKHLEKYKINDFFYKRSLIQYFITNLKKIN